MEDLVLDATVQSRMSSTFQRIGKPAKKVTEYPPPPQREAPTLPDKNENNELDEMPRDIPLSRPDSPLSRSESPLSSLGHLGLVRGQRNALQAELRNHQDAAAEAKQSIASLRKLALRLAVRISVKEAKIANHAKALSRARMAQYMAQSSTSSLPEYQRPRNLFPLSPPLSPGPGKPLPALPRWDSSGRVPTVRFSPYTGARSDTASSGDEKLSLIDASRASLKEELNATQTKLAQLFESQAILRERYNVEKSKSRQLDAECQKTHARISSLEQSKQQIEDEARHLHGYVEELEDANNKLRGELKTAKVERHNIQDDLSKLQSSKLTLEHQLQAATGSKEHLETQLQDLHKTSGNVRKELEDKLAVLESESKDSNTAIAGLEAEKQKLDEDLRITKFRLNAAVDLEDQLRTQLSTLKDREFNLEHDLLLSRDTVAKLEEELLIAYEKLSAMDKSVDELNAKLLKAEEARMDHESAARLAKASKERISAHLKKMEKSRNKAHGKLRSTKSDLVLSKNRIVATESELEVLQGDLARVQQRNNELEALVEKAEVTLTSVVEKTNASVGHIEAIMADSKILPFKHYFSDEDTAETSLAVEQQLLAHQKEIDTLHHTNATLVAKLEAMTEELHELKSASRPGTQMSGTQPARSNSSIRGLSSPGPPPEVVAAEQLYEEEMQQLKETRTTFDRVVRSLQTKSAELATMELWHNKDHPRAISIPSISTTPHTPSTEDLLDPNVYLDAKGGKVRSWQPKVITPDYGTALNSYFAESRESGSGKRPRIKSVAADIETMPQIPDIETMPRKPSIPKKPPPIPISIDNEIMPRLSLHKSYSESALKTLNSLNEDKSFWRIGDISTIAGAGEGTPRTPRNRRRSVSMHENILRRPKDSPMESDEWPRSPLSPKSPFSIPPLSPRLLRDAAYSYPSGISPRSPRDGTYAAALSPTFLREDPYPFPPKAITSSESLVASSAALPSPTLSRTSKQLPSRPSHSHHESLPRNVIDKDLPPIPRRPVPASKAKTTDDIPTTTHKWSLFPRTSDSLDIPRPATATGYFPFNAGPRKFSSQSMLVFVDEGGNVQEHDSRQPTPEPVDIGLAVTRDETPEPQPTTIPRSRTLKLKKSLSLLTGRSKKQAASTAEKTPVEEAAPKRGLSFLYRSSKPRPLEVRRLPMSGERFTPSPLYSPLSPLSPGFLSAGSPTPTRATFPNGINEPVGIYDPVSKMWLTPQARKSSHFGVFDPESKAWLAPSPRTDSLRQAASMDQMATTSNLDLNRLSRVIEHEMPDAANEEEDEEEEEEPALSLAEQLEIIRSKPLKRDVVQTSASSVNTYYTAAESPETPKPVNEKERPWKPGKILGLDRPPSSLMFSVEGDKEDDKASVETAKPTQIATEPKAEAETEWEETSKKWKDKLRSVRLLRKPSNLKRS